MDETKPMERGESVEWCPKCMMSVFPLRLYVRAARNWCCPACWTPTRLLSPLPASPAQEG